MSASVQVLCPNGRRQNVKITPNSKLLQILEEVCAKQGYSATDHQLKHGRKLLDTTLSVRYSGLPNHAKLELVKTETQRAETNVTVGLQLESGERLLHEFPPATALWEILQHWEQQPGSAHHLTSPKEGDLHPVCIYMREEVVGELALKETSLRSLGLTGGRTIIRLIHRQVPEGVLQEIKDKINKEKAKQEKLAAKALERQNSGQNVSSPVSQVAPASEAPSPAQMDVNQGATDKTSSDNTIIDKKTEDDAVAMDTTDATKDNRTDAAVTAAAMDVDPVAMTTTEQQEQPPAAGEDRPVAAPAQPSLSASEQAVSELQNIPGIQVFRPSDFTSLSQQEQELGRRMAQAMMPSLMQRPAGQQQTRKGQQKVVEFKFPESTKGKQLYQNEFSQVKKEEFKPCDRQTIVYSLDEARQSAQSGNQEDLPDDFFEITEADLRRMMVDLQKRIQSDGEQPLMTKTMREAQKEVQFSKYERTVVRVQFPDRLVLQGIFRPRETVHALYKYVKEHLEDKQQDFYLYTAPPKCVLKDRSETLIQANLVPMSVVHFGSEVNEEHHLSTAVLYEVSSQDVATRTVMNVMKLAGDERTASRPTQTAGNSSKRPVQPAGTSKGQGGPSEAKQMPKWFKAGKK